MNSTKETVFVTMAVYLLRNRRRRQDNIKMYLQEVGCGGVDWIELAQVAGSCECGNEPSGYIKCGEILNWLTNG
jgi:hypothetical protein